MPAEINDAFNFTLLCHRCFVLDIFAVQKGSSKLQNRLLHLFHESIFYYVRPLLVLLAGQYFSKIFFRGKLKSLQNFRNFCILFFANVDRMWYFLFSRTNEKENIFHERLYYRTEDYSGRRFWHSKKTKKNFNGLIFMIIWNRLPWRYAARLVKHDFFMIVWNWLPILVKHDCEYRKNRKSYFLMIKRVSHRNMLSTNCRDKMHDQLVLQLTRA